MDMEACKVLFLGLTAEGVAGISAGVIAAIVISAIVAVALVGAISSKKAYDYYMSKGRNSLFASKANPLYNNEGLTGSNPLHEGGNAVELRTA